VAAVAGLFRQRLYPGFIHGVVCWKLAVGHAADDSKRGAALTLPLLAHRSMPGATAAGGSAALHKPRQD
jgi:hypothetical protein